MPRVEARLEQPHQQPGDVHVGGQALLDVVLAERRAGLAQVLGVGAQHHRLPPGQPGPQDQRVEAVALGVARPDRGEGVLEQRPGVVDGQLARRLVAQPEVVDPGRGAAGALDLVGPLVDDLDAHLLQPRQHQRQRDRVHRRGRA